MRFITKMFILLTALFSCLACKNDGKKIDGIWALESVIQNDDTIELSREKVLFNFFNQEFEVKKFNPSRHPFLDSIRGSTYSIEENAFKSNLFPQNPKAEFELTKNSLTIGIDELQIRLKKLTRLNSGENIEEVKEIFENYIFRFNNSQVYCEFDNNGTYITSSIDPFEWVERWNCTNFGNEIFFSIVNSNIPLFQLKMISSDSVYLRPVLGKREGWNLASENINSKYKIDEILGVWRVITAEFITTEIVDTQDITKLISSGFQKDDIINFNSDSIEFTNEDTIFEKKWRLSKSGELIYFRNEMNPNEHIQWNIIELNVNQLIIEQSVRNGISTGTKRILAKRE